MEKQIFDEGWTNIPFLLLLITDSLAQLEWIPLLGSSDTLASAGSEELSKEEALRRERMRASHGLHTFSLQQRSVYSTLLRLFSAHSTPPFPFIS